MNRSPDNGLTIALWIFVGGATVLLTAVVANQDKPVPPTAPEALAAFNWAQEHLNADRVGVVCEGQSCRVWGIYEGFRAMTTSPPVDLVCSPARCGMVTP